MNAKELWSIRWDAMRKWRGSGVHYPRGIVKKEAVELAGKLNNLKPDYYIYTIVPAVEPGDKEKDD